MRERPILFSAPMVRAQLSGAKTQTRRIVKGLDGLTQPIVLNEETGEWGWWWTEWRWEGSGLDARHIPYADHFKAICCPYGAPGDRLYVRETWACHFATDDQRPRDIDPTLWSVRYAADGHIRPAASDGSQALPEQFTKTRVSIHMPRWASRILLEITEVRVARLQDISEADALAEGVPYGFDHHPIAEIYSEADGKAYCRQCGGWGVHGALGHNLGVTEVSCSECDAPGKLFRNLWRSINGDGSWDANPWVWAVSFRPVAGITAPSTSDGEGAQHVGAANGKPTEPNTQSGAQ